VTVRYILDPSPQGSPEWFAARLGKATSSKANCINAKNRAGTGEGTTRRDYRVQLVTERLTGQVQDDGYQSKHMVAGKENEPYARLAYEAETGNIVRQAGFAYLTDMAAGASVDGFIDDDPDGKGVLEAKCPKSAIHVAYMLAKRLPPEYVDQATHEVWITEADFLDFISFDPRMPEHRQLFRIRVYRKEFDLKGHEANVRLFLSEVDALQEQLMKKAA
jgi:hypothetical protein